MKKLFIPQWVLLLLFLFTVQRLAWGADAPLLDQEAAEQLGDVAVYMAIQQKKLGKVRSAVGSGGYVPTGNVFADIVGNAIVAGVQQAKSAAAYRKAISFPPELSDRPDLAYYRDVKSINKALQEEGLRQRMSSLFSNLLSEDPWFNISKIKESDTKVRQKQLVKLINLDVKRRKALADAALLVNGIHYFGLDYYRIWYVVDFELVDMPVVPQKGKRPLLTRRDFKTLHKEKFVAMFDLRDYVKSQTFESGKDPEGFQVIPLWLENNAALYHQALEQLTLDVSGMIRQYMVKQPPYNVAKEDENLAVIGLYKEREEAPPLSDKEVKLMSDFNKYEKQSYLLGKTHEFATVVHMLEQQADKVIVRDPRKNYYYSLLNKNLTLVPAEDI